MAEHLVGVIGGSGLYQMKDLKILEKIPVETPFGSPSAELVRGELQGAVIHHPRDDHTIVLTRFGLPAQGKPPGIRPRRVFGGRGRESEAQEQKGKPAASCLVQFHSCVQSAARSESTPYLTWGVSTPSVLSVSS